MSDKASPIVRIVCCDSESAHEAMFFKEMAKTKKLQEA